MKKYSLQKYHKRKTGFTIIETLVAIAILMIAIAGPLTIVHKGLLAAVYASQQVTASYLAQDAIEFVKNAKDNNIADGTIYWLKNLDVCVAPDPINGLGPCSVDTINGNPGNTGGPTGVSPCVITRGLPCFIYTGANGYTYDSTTGVTPYSRYFYLTNVSADEAKMVVIISWKSGTIENVFSYESEIFRVVR